VTEADLLAISFAFGFIITALVYAIGKVSGCHINPAVTFALAVTKRFPWKEVPIYWGAQYVGAIIGAFAIWGVFGANAVTFGMGQTHFAADASTTVYLQAALAEALGTGLLLFAILASSTRAARAARSRVSSSAARWSASSSSSDRSPALRSTRPAPSGPSWFRRSQAERPSGRNTSRST